MNSPAEKQKITLFLPEFTNIQKKEERKDDRTFFYRSRYSVTQKRL